MGNDESKKDYADGEVLGRRSILEEKSQPAIKEIAAQDSTLERPRSAVSS